MSDRDERRDDESEAIADAVASDADDGADYAADDGDSFPDDGDSFAYGGADNDDGRTVADMSGVEGHGSFLSAVIGLRGERKRRRREVESPVEDDGGKIVLTREERRWYILGALKAAFLIFLAFAVGLGLIILLMVLFW